MPTRQMDGLIEEFVERSKSILRDDLVGVYLHGSAVMGCFNPEKSDVDLIVVVNRPMPDPVKRAFLEMVVDLNAQGPAKGIEMSVVLREVCEPFVYPTPYELHFSAGHLAAYSEDPEGYIRRMQGDDKDLAAHFTIIRARGRCLYGAPIEDVFDQVPRRDYLDALWYDVENASEEIVSYPMYLSLNLARVLAYGSEGLILSKKEGGAWALDRLPPEYRPLIRDALREYTEGATVVYDEALARRYAAYVVRKIRPYIGTGEEPMKQATRTHLARVAKEMAQVPFHGAADGQASNLGPIVAPFPTWKVEEADGLWCAAFVYYCCREAGFDLPLRPKECRSCHLAGCIAWEEWALGDPRIEYHRGDGFTPEPGDIVLYDRVFENAPHDHIGIVLENRGQAILAAEGNVNNVSALMERPLDEHIRAYIRIPDGFRYEAEG